ncbi:MAG: acyl-CoA dehydrogenase family protein, partial [Burkholderiaceae bacterium]|nr:acyl-CoA dehydrogenase family protein [Burkholderiaceae bacterium]
MLLHLNDEQAMLRDSIERFARATHEESPATVVAGLAELGILALAAPEPAGGLGGRGDDLMVMMEAVGAGL